MAAPVSQVLAVSSWMLMHGCRVHGCCSLCVQVLAEFMGTFEAQGGGDKGDGIITFDEFKK